MSFTVAVTIFSETFECLIYLTAYFWRLKILTIPFKVIEGQAQQKVVARFCSLSDGRSLI